MTQVPVITRKISHGALVLAALTLLLSGGAKSADDKKKPDGFEGLVAEGTLEGWYFEKEIDQPNWEAAKGGELVCKSSASNLICDKKYKDFELQLEFQLPRAATAASGSGAATKSSSWTPPRGELP